ncbi:hypothetical protein BGX21_000638 [Mortierella sp. AD011]|nr:hypothetical protein BGX20_003962 [Mortierella sp. AD010]KAF9387176.1 hypothetical protein BGX21_000638 [Mortierella sp. AD011]
MFVAWSLQILSIAQAIFNFSLGLGVGALLSVYSKHGGEYANSMRWTQNDGFIEMTFRFFHSYKAVPNKIKFAMMLTLIVSLLASVADNLFVIPIHATTRDNYKTTVTKASSQILSANILSGFGGWSTSIPYRSDIVGAMTNMISNTKNIPDAVAGQRYTPKSYPYVIGCDSLNLNLRIISDNGLTFPVSGGCATAGIAFSSNFIPDISTVRVTNTSENRLSITVEGITGTPTTLSTISSAPFLVKDGLMCGTADDSVDVFTPTNRLTSAPQTLVTKCVLPSGEIRVISLSTIKFSSMGPEVFRATTETILDGYDELLQAMEFALGSATYASTCTMFLEVKFNNSSIDVVSCYSLKSQLLNINGLSCAYFNINMLILEQQEINVDITNAREGIPLQLQPNIALAMAIRHVPKINPTALERTPISMMKGASLAAAQYMASLGQNVYADYLEGQLYVVFDVADIEEGLMIPDWLVAVVCTLAGLCILLWGWTKKYLDSMYTSSLYSIVSESIKGESHVILRSRINPLQIDDRLIVPDDDDGNDDDARSDGYNDNDTHSDFAETMAERIPPVENTASMEEIEMTDITVEGASEFNPITSELTRNEDDVEPGLEIAELTNITIEEEPKPVAPELAEKDGDFETDEGEHKME